MALWLRITKPDNCHNALKDWLSEPVANMVWPCAMVTELAKNMQLFKFCASQLVLRAMAVHRFQFKFQFTITFINGSSPCSLPLTWLASDCSCIAVCINSDASGVEVQLQGRCQSWRANVRRRCCHLLFRFTLLPIWTVAISYSLCELMLCDMFRCCVNHSNLDDMYSYAYKYILYTWLI